MKKFVVKLLIFIALIIGFDFILGSIFSRFYFKVKSGTIFTANYAIRDCKEDILLLGASEISHHFISNTIKDSIGLSCYNLGMDGLNIYFQYAVFQEIVKRHAPKILILSTNTLSDAEKQSVATIESLLPYCERYNAIKKMVIDADSTEKFKLLSNSYPYNSLIIKIFQGLIIKEPKTNGYEPLWGSGINLRLNTNPQRLNTTPKSINYFSDLVILAKKSGCKVYIVQAPRYQINNSAEDQLLFTSLSDKHKVPFLNYLPDTKFTNHPEYFKDGAHLNNQGAEILTNMLIADLKKDNKLNQNSGNDALVQ